jgi:hypothetical protein
LQSNSVVLKLVPEVEIPSLLQDKLTDTRWKRRGILRAGHTLFINSLENFNYLKSKIENQKRSVGQL